MDIQARNGTLKQKAKNLLSSLVLLVNFAGGPSPSVELANT